MSSGKALFIKDFSNGTGEGTIWATDGTESGTRQLNIHPDPGYRNALGPVTTGHQGQFDFFANFGNDLLLINLEETLTFSDEKIQIFITDGTPAGTSEVSVTANISPFQAGQFGKVGDDLIVFEGSTSVVGKEPTAEFLVTDGTKGGTRTFTIKRNPLPPVGLEFVPGPFLSLGKIVLFGAIDQNGDDTLWVSNGTIGWHQAAKDPGRGRGKHIRGRRRLRTRQPHPLRQQGPFSLARTATAPVACGLQTAPVPGRMS